MGNCWDVPARVENAQSSQNASETSKTSSKPVLSSPPSSQAISYGSENPPTPRSEGEILSSPNLKAFTFSELRNATRNFRPDSLLGEGGFGYVFKGWIDEQTLAASRPGSGMVVAVKKLKPEGFQGHKEWLTEVNYLSQLYHPNLVKLIGYCLEGENRLLVYEFMPKGSLENHLFRRGAQPLSWAIRMKVAVGAAKGLSFLHNAETQVIYRDFKASNILLDADFHAKLSDFGLAKDGPTGDRTHVSTKVMGTHGYAAPEYVATGRLTAKSDVYSFGVVLLELLSGRRALDKTKVGIEQNLAEAFGSLRRKEEEMSSVEVSSRKRIREEDTRENHLNSKSKLCDLLALLELLDEATTNRVGEENGVNEGEKEGEGEKVAGMPLLPETGFDIPADWPGFDFYDEWFPFFQFYPQPESGKDDEVWEIWSGNLWEDDLWTLKRIEEFPPRSDM